MVRHHVVIRLNRGLSFELQNGHRFYVLRGMMRLHALALDNSHHLVAMDRFIQAMHRLKQYFSGQYKVLEISRGDHNPVSEGLWRHGNWLGCE